MEGGVAFHGEDVFFHFSHGLEHGLGDHVVLALEVLVECGLADADFVGQVVHVEINVALVPNHPGGAT